MGKTKNIYSINNILYFYTIYVGRSIHDMDKSKEYLVRAMFLISCFSFLIS